MLLVTVVNFLAACLLAPILGSLIARVKARFAGRQGPPLLQPYADLMKLMRKGFVFSKTSSWISRLAPAVFLATALTTLLLLPFVGAPGLLGFAGDFVLLAYLLGLSRLFVVLAAMDSGSAFEGMGASRELLFGMLAEPVFVGALAVLAFSVGSLDLTHILDEGVRTLWITQPMILVLLAAALFVVLLIENSRIPFDDPNTHLELTMVHEVMVLDYGGPEFALVQYAASLKLWLFASLIVSLLVPAVFVLSFLNSLLGIACVFMVAGVVGVVESVVARLHFLRVPAFLTGALALVAVAFLLRVG